MSEEWLVNLATEFPEANGKDKYRESGLKGYLTLASVAYREELCLMVASVTNSQ